MALGSFFNPRPDFRPRADRRTRLALVEDDASGSRRGGSDETIQRVSGGTKSMNTDVIIAVLVGLSFGLKCCSHLF